MQTTIKAGFCLLGPGNPCNKAWKARNFSSIFQLSPRIMSGKSTSNLGNYSSKHNVRHIYMAPTPELPFKVDSASGELIMDWVHPKDADEIREYLLQHFLTETPIREMYCMDNEANEASQSTWFMNLVRDYASQPYSVIVRKKTNNGDGQIVATSLNMLELKPNSLCSQPEIDQSFGWLRRALKRELNREVDLFDRYQADKILNFGIASSRADLGKSGLLSTMANVIVKKTYRHGVRVYKAEIANVFVQRIFRKFGYDIIRTINFAEFEYPSGVKPFANSKEMLEKQPSFILVAKKLPY